MGEFQVSRYAIDEEIQRLALVAHRLGIPINISDEDLPLSYSARLEYLEWKLEKIEKLLLLVSSRMEY